MFNFARKTSINNLTNSRNNLLKQTLQKQNLSGFNKNVKFPFAKQILSEKEYEKYNLYKHVQEANTDWLQKYIKNNNSTEKYNEVVNCIKHTKENPINILNFTIAGTSCYIGTSLLSESIGQLLFAYPFYTINMYYPGTYISIVGLLLGYKFTLFGSKMLTNEFKAPYNDYDEMIKICENETNKNII